MTMKPYRNCTLSYTPPGFQHSIEIPFSAKGLSVCEKCKKNYKTRELCRHRYGHTALPTGLTYICITLDSSCTKEDGSLIDGQLIAQSIPRQPYLMKKDINGSLPICSVCKEKNYTRAYCRNKLSHKMVPWNTNYVVLSAANSDYSSRLNMSGFDSVNQRGERSHQSFEFDDKKEQMRVNRKSDGKERSPFFCEAQSRTFLAQVRVDLNKIDWLEHDAGSAWEPSHSNKYRPLPGVSTEFGNNVPWDHNVNNEFHSMHGKETQYNAGAFSNDYGHWNRTNYPRDFNNSAATWDSRRYRNVPKDYEYFSTYHNYHGQMTDAMITPKDYVTDYNTKYLSQGQSNYRGVYDRSAAQNTNGIEGGRDRPYDSYGHYEVENAWSNMAVHHSSWGYQHDRQYAQLNTTDQYSNYEERTSHSLNRSNSNKEESNFSESRSNEKYS